MSAPAEPGHDPAEGRFVIRELGQEMSAGERRLYEAVAGRNYDEATAFAVRLAVEEAISNAFHHGNAADPAKSVTLAYRVTPHEIVIEVSDEGPGFDPDAVPDPTEPENMEIPSGRGIVLMRSYMTDVSFRPPGNHVRMVYRRSAPPSAAVRQA
jgi:serine/threonine-protein kinase RsbW